MSRTIDERTRGIETKSAKDPSPTQPQHILLPRLSPRCAPPPCPHKPRTAHANLAVLNRVFSARQAEEEAFETSGALAPGCRRQLSAAIVDLEVFWRHFQQRLVCVGAALLRVGFSVVV
jgi:hypothetical protein